MTQEKSMLRRILVLALAVGLSAPALAEDKLVVFAAASLKTSLDAAAAKFHEDGGPEVSLSYGGSLGLARQIVAGAPADVFVSADEPSMDAAAEAHAIRPETRADVLRNHLVVVAPKTSALAKLDLTPAAFEAALGGSKLSTGETKTVPVGRYAKESLTKLGLWATVEPHLALSDNVRAALEFVARGEAPLGIVYATDAASESRVKVVASLPDDSHAPIVYPLAVTASSKNPEAEKFIAFLRGPGAPAFTAQGFEIVK
jgi:molybdate transport system substrate-binding protein